MEDLFSSFSAHKYMEQNISLKKIDDMRLRIIANLKEIELNKHLIRSHDRNDLNNYHNAILRILDNMVNIQKVEQADPYAKSSMSGYSGTYKIDPRAEKTNVIYNQDGTTQIVRNKSYRITNEQWEKQFDENLLLNPPCYMMPSQSLTSIPKIRNAR